MWTRRIKESPRSLETSENSAAVKVPMTVRIGVRRFVLCLLLATLLAGCKVELYTNLAEQEANEMMALLLRHGIPCEKQPGQEQTWTLVVDDRVTATALEILQENGYPKPQFKSLGDVFKREGLVSSPMEERVRFIYALSQELGHTINEIDGVISARVHIVLPENDPLSEKAIPSAASVFIKQQAGKDLRPLVPRIKALVANSIEGLSYDRVTIVLVESEPATTASLSPMEATKRLPPGFGEVSAWIVGGGAGVLGLLMGFGSAWFVFRRKKVVGGLQPSSPSESSE